MRIQLALAVGLFSVALQASAATVVDTAPAKKKAQAVQPRVAKPVATEAFSEYLQWHRDSGFAIYASPLEVVAPDVTPDSCAKASTPAVN
jgi:hypothetical protein